MSCGENSNIFSDANTLHFSSLCSKLKRYTKTVPYDFRNSQILKCCLHYPIGQPPDRRQVPSLFCCAKCKDDGRMTKHCDEGSTVDITG